jgi:DNA polymerase-3 subunit alpha
VLEALIKSGSCDSLGDRGWLLAELDTAMRRAEQAARDLESGQIQLFDLDGSGDRGPAGNGGPLTPPPAGLNLSPEAERERLSWERELLGIYLSQHPLQQLGSRLRACTDTEVADLVRLEGRTVQVGGSLRECRVVQNRKGDPMAFAALEDLTGVCELVIFPRVFEKAAELLHPDSVVVVRGRVEVGARPGPGGANPASPKSQRYASGQNGDEPGTEEPEEARVIAEDVLGLDDPQLAGWRPTAVVHVTVANSSDDVLGRLSQALGQQQGGSPVVLHLQDQEGRHDIELGESHRVDVGEELERAVVEVCGPDTYRVETIRAQAVVPDRQKFRAR